ncbi:hypothetical protein [uncultured Brachyspira sp.]|uniref:hypothetical protein n=1 Tax=uncultured Brachyspira sp. TaxID=221953 RepID=UPI00260AFD6A|nr:hypothetical protein [uncultured Brachyspira sp.]
MRSITILLIGGCVIVGIAVYKIYKNINNTKIDLKNDNQLEKNKFNSTKYSDSNYIKDIYEIKKITSDAIKNRHRESAKYIEKSLNTVFKESENGDIVTDNMGDLKKIDSDLNDLLK